MMRTTALSLLVLAAGVLTSSGQNPPGPARHTLMPVPASIAFQAGRLTVSAAFATAITGAPDARLLAGIDRALRRLERRTGLVFPRALAKDASAAALVIESGGPGLRVPAVNEDESYTLEIGAAQAVLKAPTSVGVLRGLETLLQLLQADRDGYFLPAVKIQDQPRFPWRGLLMDVGRHFMPVEVIKRNLDGMAAVKLNVLHLHLTEDQGFRIESRKFPKLHQMGSDGLYFTQDQIRDIVSYAAERGIRVVPEFDMPGHTSAWMVGHPELASAPGPYQIERKWGVFDPTMDPTREQTYKFLDVFLGEMAGLFPDAYLHIGGDENNGRQWAANPAIGAFMAKQKLADAHALQAYFNQRLSAILKKHGKKMIGWDEILHPALPKDIVVQSWRGASNLADAARKGYFGILSNGYYIDLVQPASQHYLVDPLPADTALTPEEAARVLGGEATMWAEWVTPETVDSRIWPRTAAIAERFWSPGSVRDVPDMYRRLAVISLQLEEVGLKHESQQDMMLRRLANSTSIEPLKILISVVEPVKGYARGSAQPGTQLSPLTRFVDAARPESTSALAVGGLVDELLADAPRFTDRRLDLVAVFQAWRNLVPALDRITDRAPALAEIGPLGHDLASIGEAGHEALSFIASGVKPRPEWRDAALAALDKAAAPRGAVRLMVVPALRKLVIAAAEIDQAAALTPAAWKQRVEALALSPKK
jgi:hexosaminidase